MIRSGRWFKRDSFWVSTISFLHTYKIRFYNVNLARRVGVLHKVWDNLSKFKKRHGNPISTVLIRTTPPMVVRKVDVLL